MTFLAKLKLALTPKKYGYYPANFHVKPQVFLELINAGKLQAAHDLFCSESRVERTYLLEAASDMVAQDDFFDDWFNKSNGPPLSCLFRGALLTRRAWVHRGSGGGDSVSDESANMMVEALKKAYNSLIPIIDDPKFGQDAAAIIIRLLMGLNADWEYIDEMLASLRSHSEPHLLGEMHYLVASCEKWHGSHEKMYQCAHQACDLYPDNPEMMALHAAAHWERQLYYDAFDKDEIGSEAYSNNATILTDMTYRSERLLKQKDSSNSQTVIAHNVFAAFFCGRGEWDLAKPHFEKIKSRVCAYPWSFYDDDYYNQVYNIALM